MASENAKAIRDQQPRCAAPTADFGELLTSRGFEGWAFLWRFASACMLALFALLFVAVAIWAPPSKGASGSSWTSGAFMAVLMGGLAYFFLRRIMIACDFYESGVVLRAWRRTSEYPYADVEWFIYNLVRQYHNGIYAGTSLTLKMKMDDSHTFSYSGTHKEKKKGILFKSRFEGEDEMDLVREAIEIHVAERVEQELAQNGQVDWCGCAKLKSDGLVPARGKKKGTLVPWNEMGAMWYKNGQFSISSAAEEKKGFITIPVMGRNFFACQRVFGRLAEPAVGKEMQAAEQQAASQP